MIGGWLDICECEQEEVHPELRIEKATAVTGASRKDWGLLEEKSGTRRATRFTDRCMPSWLASAHLVICVLALVLTRIHRCKELELETERNG